MTLDLRLQRRTGRGRFGARAASFACGGLLAAASALAFPLTGSAHSTTLFVHPGDSIQAAVDSAKPGDTVKVLAGTYHQQVNITTDDITLKGEGPSDTIIMPPAAPSGAAAPVVGNCDAAVGLTGICVGVGPIAEGGIVNRVVEGVTIKSLTVTGFESQGGVGLFLFGTDEGTVENVHASNDGTYGIFFNNSTNGVVDHNLTTGNHEAGIYYGDSTVGGALITDNTSRNNAIGIFVRDASHGKVLDNTSSGNCLGILFLNTGSGNTDWLAKDNDVNKNNNACPPSGGPPTSGIGIAVVSGDHITLRDNTANGNVASGPTLASGGIVLVPGPGGPTTFINVVDNDAHKNSTDIVVAVPSPTNHFADNDCTTSSPPGLC
jgi:hypothetical protein